MKNSDIGLIIIVLIAFGVFSGYIAMPQLNIGGGGTGGGNDLTNTLDFILLDQWAGSGMSSKSIKVYEGSTYLEACTTASDGTIETVKSYRSGQALNILVDCGSNERWVQLIVPNHDINKVQASDPTPITLYGSTHPTLTDLVHDESGTAIADAGKLNYTAKGSTETITYSWFVSTDNTGLLASGYDPLDAYTPQIVLYVTCSDTTVSVQSGMSGSFMKGSSIVYYKTLAPEEVTRYKVGNAYVHDGASASAFTLDLSSCTGTSATVQIDLYEADDPSYYQNHYAHSPFATALCESTISLDNT